MNAISTGIHMNTISLDINLSIQNAIRCLMINSCSHILISFVKDIFIIQIHIMYLLSSGRVVWMKMGITFKY